MKKFLLPLTFLALVTTTGLLLTYNPAARTRNTSTAGAPVKNAPLLVTYQRLPGSSPPIATATGKPPQTLTPPMVPAVQPQSTNITPSLTEAPKKQFVLPPVSDRVLSFETVTVEPSRGITWRYSRTGTVVQVPADALVFADGTPVTEPVKIQFREYDMPSEIFLSGIPMELKNKQYLESGGMVEIRAYAGDKEVFIKPDKSVTIQMESAFTDKDYNLYAFDESKGKWVVQPGGFTYPDSGLVNNSSSTGKIAGYIELVDSAVLTNIAGFSYHKSDTYDQQDASILRYCDLTLQYDSKYFPELKRMAEYTFRSVSHTFSDLEKIMENNLHSSFRKALIEDEAQNRNMPYNDIRLLYPGNKGPVDLVFSDGGNELVIGVEPLVKNKRMQEKFISQYGRYTAQYDSARPRRVYMYKKRRQFVDDINAIKDDRLREQAFQFYNGERLIRQFTVNNFGIWNCDRPVNPNGEIVAKAEFLVNGSRGDIRQVYTADLKRNGIMNALPQDFQRFRFSKQEDNMIWVVLPGNRIGYLMPDDLQQVEVKDGAVTFNLKEMPVDDFLRMMDGQFTFFRDKNRSDITAMR